MEDSLPPELLEEYKQAFQILDRKNIGMISLRVNYLQLNFVH